MPDHSNYLFYNKSLQPYANQLRKEMTKAEACLWKYVLRARQLNGFQFRRQRPVLKYIADFMCKELMLIIEVDGSIHQLEEMIERDKFRQKELEYAGFTVLRFSNEEVLTNIQGIYKFLEEWIEHNPRPQVKPAPG